MSGRNVRGTSVTVNFKGPFFETATRNKLLADMQRDIQDDTDKMSVDLIVSLFDAVLKHQTPYYTTRIKAHRHSTHSIIDDQRVVYGPWLEGTGSRNYPVTRFKGYHVWRRASQIIDEKAHAVARRHVSTMVRKMNGR